MKGERFLSLPLAVKPHRKAEYLTLRSWSALPLTLNSPRGGERFLCLPLAVEPPVDGGLLPDLTLNSPRGG